MLFGVLDEITDMTRSSGMVQRKRLIYRMIWLGEGARPTGLLVGAKGSFAEVRDQTPGTLVSVSKPADLG